MKKVVVFGHTGAGKSALCNILSGSDQFVEGASIISQTQSTTVRQAKWLGNGADVIVIDTPGFGDSNGNDTANIQQMVEVLKQQTYVNTFVFLFNPQSPRLDDALKSMITTLTTIFGTEYFKHAIFGFSRWGFDGASVRRRNDQNVSEISTAANFAGFFKSHFGLTFDIPSFFYEKEYKVGPQNFPPGEYEQYAVQIQKLTSFMQRSQNCDTRGLVAIAAEKERLRIQAEEERRGAEAAETERRRQEVLAAEQRRIAEEQQRIYQQQLQRAAEEARRAEQARAAAALAYQQQQAEQQRAAVARQAQLEAQRQAEQARLNAIVSQTTEHQQVNQGGQFRRVTDRKTRWHKFGYRDTVWWQDVQRVQHQQRTKTVRGSGAVEYSNWWTSHVEERVVHNGSHHE